MMLYGPDAPPVAMVKNFVSSVSDEALSVSALSVAAVSLPSELGDEHAAKPSVTLSIADNSNGDFRELIIEFILEMVILIRLITSTFTY